MSIVSAYAVPHPPLIIPEVGGGEQRKIQKTINAYNEIARRIALDKPETIVVATPHAIMYSNYNHLSPGDRAQGDFGRFGRPDVRFQVAYDGDLAKMIAAIAAERMVSAGLEGEKDKALDHGTMVPLHFVNAYLSDYKIVRISLSGLSPLAHYELGKAITEASNRLNKKTVFLASGDLSHKLKADGPYGFASEGPAFDAMVTESLASGDFSRLLHFDEGFCDLAAECGLRSFIMMAGALDGKAVKPELLAYEGPFGVGYAVAAFAVLADDPDRRFGERFREHEAKRLAAVKTAEDAYVKLARASLEHYFRHRRHMEKPKDLAPELLHDRAGVFVSLKIDGRLRGCIGTIEATTASLADEIIQNAVSAGFRDPRFDPVGADELDRLVYSVDVLTTPEPIESTAQLDPKRYGLIVKHRGRSGLLLPDLDGIETPEDQLRIALRKGNISPEDDYARERFQVIRHH